MESDFLIQLQSKLKGPLPGQSAHLLMAHKSRVYYPKSSDNVRLAGVLILFYPVEQNWHVVFIERNSSNTKDKHRGQISFPGGKIEKEDSTIIDTALREAEEEVGVDASKVRVLGQLTDLYIPVSNFKVFPSVGFVNYQPQFIPETKEVHDIIEVPFRKFLEPSVIKQTSILVSDKVTLNQVPYFDIEGKVIWGATAMIMSELLTVFKSG